MSKEQGDNNGNLLTELPALRLPRIFIGNSLNNHTEDYYAVV